MVSTTSDGIFTVSGQGVLLSWNPACERITGLSRRRGHGAPDVMRRLEAQTGSGLAMDLHRWAADPALPRDILGDHRGRVAPEAPCSITPATEADGDDATFISEVHEGHHRRGVRGAARAFSQLVEAQADQRLVVEHLQRAVAPDPPDVDGTNMAV